MPTVEEVIASVNELVTENRDNAKALADALREHAKPVAKVLTDRGARMAARDGDAALKAAEEKATKAAEELEAVQAEFEAFKAKTPYLATREAEIRAKYEKKLEEKDKALRDRTDRAIELQRRQLRAAFVEELLEETDGKRVDREWAEKVVAREFDDRLVAREDGTEDVLQPGEAIGFDAPTTREKLKLLAAEAKKTVPDRYLVVGGQSGGGTSGGHGSGGYDPVAAGKKMAAEQKGNAVDPTLAFR